MTFQAETCQSLYRLITFITYRFLILVQIARCSFAYHITQGFLHHSPLLEQVMYRFVFKVVHRALAEERQPRLDAAHACTQCQITENNQVERDGSSKNGVTAQELTLISIG